MTTQELEASADRREKPRRGMLTTAFAAGHRPNTPKAPTMIRPIPPSPVGDFALTHVCATGRHVEMHASGTHFAGTETSIEYARVLQDFKATVSPRSLLECVQPPRVPRMPDNAAGFSSPSHLLRRQAGLK
jgi:hypothetical protein